MGLRTTQCQVKSTSLSSHPGTTLHTWTFSTSAAITTSGQNLCVPKNVVVAVKDTHRIRGRDKSTNNSSKQHRKHPDDNTKAEMKESGPQ